MAVQLNPFVASRHVGRKIDASRVHEPQFGISSSLTRGRIADVFHRSRQSQAQAATARKGGIGRAMLKATKYALSSNMVTLPLALAQFLIAPFSAGITLITGLKTIFLGPLIAGGVGFVKGLAGK